MIAFRLRQEAETLEDFFRRVVRVTPWNLEHAQRFDFEAPEVNVEHLTRHGLSRFAKRNTDFRNCEGIGCVHRVTVSK